MNDQQTRWKAIADAFREDPDWLMLETWAREPDGFDTDRSTYAMPSCGCIAAMAVAQSSDWLFLADPESGTTWKVVPVQSVGAVRHVVNIAADLLGVQLSSDVDGWGWGHTIFDIAIWPGDVTSAEVADLIDRIASGELTPASATAELIERNGTSR